MKLKYVLSICLIASLVLCSACSKKTSTETTKISTESNEEDKVTTEGNANGGNTQIDNTKVELSQNNDVSTNVKETNLQQESMEAYENFMRNEAKISFERNMSQSFIRDDLFETGSEHTLSQVLNVITSEYFESSTNKKIDFIDYSYIDCGKDGVNELALRFHGMDIYSQEDDSTLVFIIKYIEGNLSLCYSYETWARSWSTINEYGYYQSSGSGGASYHVTEYGSVDKDGTWQSIAWMESEMSMDNLAWMEGLEQIPTIAQSKGITGGIELQTTYFNKDGDSLISKDLDNRESFYSFYVYDENYEPIEDANLYTNSIYKDIFDEAKVAFVTPDQISAMILEKEKEVGVTAEIKDGAEPTWKILSGNLYSDYVGR